MSAISKISFIKKEIKQNLNLSIPLISSQLIYASSGFISTAMVSKLGKEAMAASILINVLWFSLSVFFFGILNAVSVLVSHQYGVRNHQKISNIMGQAYVAGGVIILCIFALLINVPTFLVWTKQPPMVLSLATQYLHSLMWMIPALIILIISEQFLAGIGQGKIILRISCIVVPIEIPLIYILIFGKLGLPTCGVSGVGYGLAITYSASAIGLLLYLFKNSYYRPFQIFANIFTRNFSYLKELLKVGIPIGMLSVIEVSTFAIATLWIGKFGTTMLAANQIIMQYLGFAITLVVAMSQAVAIRIGHVASHQDIKGVKLVIFTGILLNALVVAIIALCFNFIPELFIRLDIDIHAVANRELVQHAKQLLGIAGILLFFDNIRIIGYGALRGLKDTRFPMYLTCICFWLIGLSLAYMLAFNIAWGGRGIWWGLVIGIIIGAITILMRIKYILARVELKTLSEIKE